MEHLKYFALGGVLGLVAAFTAVAFETVTVNKGSGYVFYFPDGPVRPGSTH